MAILFLALLPPVQAVANAGWPGAWVIASTAQAYKNFLILVVLSLTVEALILWRASGLIFWKSCGLTILANFGSTVVGFGLGYAFLYTDFLFEKMDIGGKGAFLGDLLIIFMVSVIVEAGVVRFFWKAPWKKIIPVMSISNATTHALGVYYLLTTVR